MPKRIVQDMVRRKSASPARERVQEVKVPEKLISREAPRFESREEAFESRRSGRIRFRLWLTALFAVLVLLFALSWLFESAQVIIEPKTQKFDLKEEITAEERGMEGLSFDLTIIPGSKSERIFGGQLREVAERAEGVAIIYNTFSTTTQTLAIDTRLEGSNGKIYKTKERLSVPGMASDGTPGSIEVPIYAAEVGEAYNTTPVDFTILGFKGTPKYTKFYGRSKGEIKGGFKGLSNILTREEEEVAINKVRQALTAELLVRATEEIPEGFVLFEGGTSLESDVEEVSRVVGGEEVFEVKVSGFLQGILFKRQELDRYLARKFFPNTEENIYISNMPDLTFILTSPEMSRDTVEIQFKLEGPALFVFRVDEQKLAGELTDRKKNEFPEIVSKYPAIRTAHLSVRPFWKRYIPRQKEDIHILVDYPVDTVSHTLIE